MEAENRGVVETQLTVFDLAISHGRPGVSCGIVMWLVKTGTIICIFH